MDLRLFGRVLWRFRLIVLLGLLLAIALAALSVVRVSTSGKISYRQSQLWSSTTRLGVTQTGFPWGRLFAQQPAAAGQATPTPEQQAARLGIPIADPNRLNNLAVLYSQLATSDQVHSLMLRDGPIVGQILAVSLVEGDNRIMLPLIDITAISNSPQAAVALSLRSARALENYVAGQQRSNNVPTTDRVLVQEILSPKQAHLYQGRSKTMPIVILLAVLFAIVGLAFLLENMRPRARRLDESVEPDMANAARRRTA
jgi:hypothetical protein